MRIVLLRRSIVEGLEGALVVRLLPVLHIKDAGARGVVTDEDVVSFIVINGGVAVHDLGHDVCADLAEGGTEDYADVCFEPAEAGHELVDASEVVPGDEF